MGRCLAGGGGVLGADDGAGSTGATGAGHSAAGGAGGARWCRIGAAVRANVVVARGVGGTGGEGGTGEARVVPAARGCQSGGDPGVQPGGAGQCQQWRWCRVVPRVSGDRGRLRVLPVMPVMAARAGVSGTGGGGGVEVLMRGRSTGGTGGTSRCCWWRGGTSGAPVVQRVQAVVVVFRGVWVGPVVRRVPAVQVVLAAGCDQVVIRVWPGAPGSVSVTGGAGGAAGVRGTGSTQGASVMPLDGSKAGVSGTGGGSGGVLMRTGPLVARVGLVLLVALGAPVVPVVQQVQTVVVFRVLGW